MSELVKTGTEFRVNTTTTNDQQNVSLSALSDGGYVIVWQSRNQDGSSWGVYGQRYNASGNAVGSEFLVNSNILSGQFAASVSGFAGGGFVVSWHGFNQDGSSTGVYAQRYDVSGNVAGGEFQVNTTTSGSQQLSDVATLSSGGFVVVWQSAAQDGSDNGIYGQRYNSSGSVVGTEFQINTFTAGSQQTTSVVGLDDGGFVVVWDSADQDGSDSGIYGQRYNASGNIVGAEFQINSFTAGTQSNATIAALNQGGFIVVWDSAGQDGASNGIYGQRYNVSGNAIGNEFLVNTTTMGNQTRAVVTGLSDGGFVVSWQSFGQDGSAFGIYGQCFDNVGNAVGGEFLINSTTTGNQMQPSIDTLVDGRVIVAWHSVNQDGSGTGVYAQLFGIADDADLPTTEPTAGAEFQINTHIQGVQEFSVVTALADGGFVVAWHSDGQDGSGLGVYGQRYDSNGQTVGSEFQINSSTLDDQRLPAITALSDGGFVVVWQSFDQDGDNWGVFGQRYDVSGNTVGGEFLVNTTTIDFQQEPTVTALADGGFVVSWQSNGQPGGSNIDIYGQLYNANGQTVGGEFIINTTINFAQQNQAMTAFSALNGGGFLMAWHSFDQDGSSTGIVAQRFDSSGVKVGPEFLVNTSTAGSQFSPSVATFEDGSFIVTWEGLNPLDPSNTTLQFEIYGQRYAANGDTIGGEFQINTEDAGHQFSPSVTALSDGSFVVVWRSFGQDGGSWGVYGQRYAANGNKLGDEFLINNRTAGSQNNPWVTSLPDGGFVVTWESKGQDGSDYGVFGRRYSFE